MLNFLSPRPHYGDSEMKGEQWDELASTANESSTFCHADLTFTCKRLPATLGRTSRGTERVDGFRSSLTLLVPAVILSHLSSRSDNHLGSLPISGIKIRGPAIVVTMSPS